MNSNRTRMLRMAAMAVVAITIVIGAVRNDGTGSLSVFGAGNITAICPLGYLETLLAGREFIPPLFISFLIIAGLTVLLGRVFCGWVCPVPLVRKLLVNKLDEGRQVIADKTVSDASAQPFFEDRETANASCSPKGFRAKKNSASGLVILGITLGSSAICGFPVFCLICPIGLVFATLFALIRLLHFNEPTLDLIVFPIVIIIELVFLKRWCSKLCPVGALLSLFSRFNRSLVPTVERSFCLEESRNTKCQRCRSVCSFDVDLKNGRGTGDISDCTKCRECADNCPVQAIRFPWR
ncbi:4Fe-4S binding protein [Sporomusa acidovorans]|uniref:4Fe-4S ferredoxin-type domain-containing protein n=1 Tax=Sporomusa acidovorans (strain ATCC 49682 / DSM 3132 / Mol) TaxID=1123286 RepID=A0ABZ3J2E8_SPOA4|nr:4Fe-4S binding protein [Sporomusa acidovorans]OZC23177.1 quinol dehydrogenase membrane component [Sporomusa acidovorans DSM 3132]SDE96741.1 ferredoxin-type protein NapH [Sporomusa acidovorans]